MRLILYLEFIRAYFPSLSICIVKWYHKCRYIKSFTDAHTVISPFFRHFGIHIAYVYLSMYQYFVARLICKFEYEIGSSVNEYQVIYK